MFLNPSTPSLDNSAIFLNLSTPIMSYKQSIQSLYKRISSLYNSENNQENPLCYNIITITYPLFCFG